METINDENILNKKIFDIKGRRMNSNSSQIEEFPNGIYIINGKKVMIGK